MDARAVREDRFMARRVLVGSGPMPTFSNEADKFMRIRSSLHTGRVEQGRAPCGED